MTWALLAAAAGLVVALVAVRRAYTVVLVDGPSMEPALAHGDRVLVRRRAPRRDEIVVVRYPGRVLPGRPWPVTRVAATRSRSRSAACSTPCSGTRSARAR